MVYSVGTHGADLLAEEPGFRRAVVDWTAKARDISHSAIEHALGVSRFMVQLERACRERGSGLRVLYLDDILATVAPTETRLNAKPYFWPVQVRWQGKEILIHPIPDKIFGIQDKQREAGKDRRWFFFEEDRGTMPVIRSSGLSKSSYLRKLLAYGTTYKNDLHKKVYGFSNMRVLTVTRGPDRIQSIIEAHRRYTWQLCSPRVFLFADRQGLARAADPLEFPWLDAAGEQHRLLD